VLADLDGPIFYYREKDQIILRRWVRILLGEGQETKQLSAEEEEDLLDLAKRLQLEYHRGYLTPKKLRDLAGMSHTNSEIVQSSQILKRWVDQGKIQRIKKGVYKFEETEASSDVTKLMKALLDAKPDLPEQSKAIQK